MSAPQVQPAADATVARPGTVGVAVVSWNTCSLLRDCLHSLRPEAEQGATVCVVDNASSDGSPEMVAAEFPWVDLVALDDNPGFGRAINLAAQRLPNDWLGIANADIALTPGALTTLQQAGQADAQAGAVAPRLILPDGSTQHSVFPFPTLGFTALFNLGLLARSRSLADRYALVGRWDKERARRVPWAVGAFLLVRRQAWEQIGGFDERQWMYAEDLDLGWRLHRAGWATRYEPKAVVHHHSSAATAQAWDEPERTARWQRATYAWMLHRRGMPITRAVAALNVAGSAARYLLLTPLALLAPHRYKQPRDAARWWARLHAQGLAPAKRLRTHR